jgi:6-phosphogluconolactonase
MPKRRFCLAAISLVMATLAACGGGNNAGVGVIPPNPAATVYVSLPSSDQVAEFRVDTTNHFTGIIGSPFSAGTSPTSVLVHPNNKFVYVVNQGSSNISLLTPDSRTGVLTEVLPRTPTGVSPVSMKMNKTGNLIFVLNQASATISVFSVDSSTGALTEISGSPVATAIHPSAFALARAENFLFVANVNLNSVSAYTLASGGALQQVGSYPLAGTGPVAVAAGASDHFLYVVNQISSNISVMAINDTTGALSEIVGSPIPTTTSTTTTTTTITGPNSVVLDSTGSFVYVTNATTNNLSAFSVDSNTGKLNALTGSPYTAGTGPTFSVINPSGTILFVAGASNTTITHFTINADGTLTAATDTQSTPTAPSSMAFTH